MFILLKPFGFFKLFLSSLVEIRIFVNAHPITDVINTSAYNVYICMRNVLMINYLHKSINLIDFLVF